MSQLYVLVWRRFEHDSIVEAVSANRDLLQKKADPDSRYIWKDHKDIRWAEVDRYETWGIEPVEYLASGDDV